MKALVLSVTLTAITFSVCMLLDKAVVAYWPGLPAQREMPEDLEDCTIPELPGAFESECMRRNSERMDAVPPPSPEEVREELGMGHLPSISLVMEALFGLIALTLGAVAGLVARDWRIPAISAVISLAVFVTTGFMFFSAPGFLLSAALVYLLLRRAATRRAQRAVE